MSSKVQKYIIEDAYKKSEIFSAQLLKLPIKKKILESKTCLLYTSPSPRDAHESRMPSSA